MKAFSVMFLALFVSASTVLAAGLPPMPILRITKASEINRGTYSSGGAFAVYATDVGNLTCSLDPQVLSYIQTGGRTIIFKSGQLCLQAMAKAMSGQNVVLIGMTDPRSPTRLLVTTFEAAR